MKRGLLAVVAVLVLAIGVGRLFLVQTGHAQVEALHLVPPAAPVPASYFGMHIHRATAATAWPSVPFGSWRLWDAHTAWPDLEPRQGKWDFTNLDANLKLAEDHHVQVLLPLGLSPKWASARPEEPSTYQHGFAAEPREPSDWDNYVRTVATHCKGKVQTYEIWNEPNYNAFYTGTIDQLIDMTHRAHDIIKSVDPTAQIVSPSPTQGVKGVAWLDDFLSKGGGKYVDVIGFHFYSETPEASVPLIQKVRQTMAAHGLSSMPLWNTEMGWAKPKPFPSDDLGAAYLARTYLLNWAAGVERLYWYAWDNHTFVTIQTLAADNVTLTPAGRAYGTISTWLKGSQVRSCDQAADHTWTCALHSARGNEWVVWNPTQTTEMTLPASWHAKTTTLLTGNPVAIPGKTIEVTAIPQLIAGQGRR